MANISARELQSSGRQAVREAAPWVQRLARMGYAAKGVVYLIIGGLAVKAALGEGGRTTDSEGALRTILQQPHGWLLLAIVAVGLAGYALWCFVQATIDPEGLGRDAKGMGQRAVRAISGAIHAGLALQGARMAFGLGGGNTGGSAAQDWTAAVLAHSMGRWIIAAVGLAIAAGGLLELTRAYRIDLPKQLDLSRLSSSARVWVVRCGRVGMGARGIVFAIIGTLVIRAALTYDSRETAGIGAALEKLHEQPHGRWLLGLVAAGLIAFGMFELVLARYRRIRAA
jgi:hypothetical protein